MSFELIDPYTGSDIQNRIAQNARERYERYIEDQDRRRLVRIARKEKANAPDSMRYSDWSGNEAFVAMQSKLIEHITKGIAIQKDVFAMQPGVSTASEVKQFYGQTLGEPWGQSTDSTTSGGTLPYTITTTGGTEPWWYPPGGNDIVPYPQEAAEAPKAIEPPKPEKAPDFFDPSKSVRMIEVEAEA
jgi:hypothetical protein